MNRLHTTALASLVHLTLTSGCAVDEAQYEDDWMDSELTSDDCLDDETCRLSARVPAPTDEELSRPVVMLVHGFSGGTFGLREAKEAFEAAGAQTSLVLLGGHGRSVAEWEQTTFEDWGRPIVEEHAALVALGYTNINLFAVSAGCPLSMRLLADGAFDSQPFRQAFLIDPFLEPVNRDLLNVHLIANFQNYHLAALNDEERRHWYSNLPAVELIELVELREEVVGRLDQGIQLPPGTKLKIYRTTYDDTAAPESADQYVAGVTNNDGGAVELEDFESQFHGFTRLDLRDATDADRESQRRAFDDMVGRLGL